MRELHITHTRN